MDSATAIDLYRNMLTIRTSELKVIEIYSSDKVQSPVHLSIGQEAVSTGVCRALRPHHRIYGTYRSHGIYIGMGADLKGMFAELYGKASGCAGGKGGSMHLVAPEVGLMGCSAIVGSTIPVGTGDALASQLQGRKWVTASFFGDGGMDEGVFYESINFAALKNLPVIYVVENNRYAIHSSIRDRHVNTELYRYGEPFGVRGSRHDGNDVFEVYDVMKDAIAESLAGGPPRLLEFMTYRWKEHVGPNADHQEAYRDQADLAAALNADPILRARQVLIDDHGVTEKDLAEWDAEIAHLVESAVQFAEESAFPSSDKLYHGVFA